MHRSGRRLIVIGEGPSGPVSRPSPARASDSWDGSPTRSFATIIGVAGPCCSRARKISGSCPIEALACGAPVIALGRGGAAETVDDAVGRTYPIPRPMPCASPG